MLSSLSSYSYWGFLLLQYTVGLIFLIHGWPKLKNIKNLFGIGGFFHGVIEVGGCVAMWFNWEVRLVALAYSIIMFGAIYMKKFKWGVPFTAHDRTGWEFDFVLLVANIYLAVH